MGIDAEDIKLCVCRILHLSLRVSHRFVQKHPYVSGTLLFLFILYIFLPSVFSFLFYCLPFLGLTGVLLAFWTSKRSTIRVEKVEGKKLEVSSKQSTITINRNRAYLRNATSRRQRFRDKSEAWRTEAPINALVDRTDQLVEPDNLKSLIEVKETQSVDSANNASAHCTSVDKDNKISSKKEPILGSELLVKPDVVACDGSSSQTNKSDSGGDEAKNESSEDPEDEDEEEAHEDRNKAVEWTEDDQKNLMDLGLSEIERNRRLENLIARRRARKLYKRKNEDTVLTVDILSPGQIPKIITTRKDPLDLADGCKDIEGVPLPGSAPSVLLPMRNPFDLPYDPQEEKPNLMADSFQQEFTAAHQKELAYCRHESFCFGPAYPEESGAMGYHPRYRRPSISIADKGEHDWLIEQLLFKGDQVPHTERKPIAVETGDIQTADSPQTRDVDAMELESDQEKDIPPDSESEFEMEPELTQDGNSQSSHSSSSDNPKNVICDDVRVVAKSFESTLSSALNRTLNCRVPKSRLIKEPLCDFSPTAFDKNKMEERFSYPDKVVCHTPTYSIASDLQVEVSEIGSPPTVDGNNTDGESLNPDWEIEKEASFGGEQDDTSPLLEGRYNERVSDVQEEEVEALSITEASPPKTIQSPMSEEPVDHPTQVVPQLLEELSFPRYGDKEAVSHMVDQKVPEALANMKNMVKTSEDVDDGLEISIKQEDNGKETRSLEETCVKSSRSLNGSSEDSSGCQAHLHHEHSEEESKNMDQITGNGDLGTAHKHSEEGSKNKDQITGNVDLDQEHSEEGSKNMDQITGSEDLSWTHKLPEEGTKNKDQITGNGDLSQAQERPEEGSKNMDQTTGSEDLGRAHKHPKEGTKNKDQIIGNGDLGQDQEHSAQASKNMDQITGNGHLGWAHEHSEEGNKNTSQTTGKGELIEPRKIEEQLEFIQDHKNQPNVVETELQSSKDALKLPIEDDLFSSGGVPLVSNDIVCSDTSKNQVNNVRSESQKSNRDLVEPRKIEEPLELKQDNKNQPNVVEIEFQRSKDDLKATVEDGLANDGGVPLDSNDIIGSDASQNQVNDVQSESQKSNRDLVEPRKIEEPLELKQENKNQPNVVEIEFQSSKDALKATVEDGLASDGGVPLDSIDIMGSDASQNQVNNVQSESQKSNRDLVEPRKIEEPLELKQDNKNQPNVVEIEFQSSKDVLEATVEDDLASDGGVPLDSSDMIGSDASQNQVNDVQSESQKSNSDHVEPRKIEELLELKQGNKNQPNVVEIEFPSSKDALKSTIEDDLASDGGVPVDSNDFIGSYASQNQANAVQSEFQKSEDAMKSTVEQDSVMERELLDTRAGLSPKSSMEEQIHMDKVSLLQDSIAEINPKTMEKDDNKPADSFEVENEFVKDLSEEKGEKSNLDANDEREKADPNLSSLNLELNGDLKISEIIEQEEVAGNYPLAEITAKEVELETELTPTTVTNIEDVGDSKIECESHSKFNKQDSDNVMDKDLEFDKDMENYSKDLNGNEAEGNPSKLRANVMGLQKATGLAHESPMDSSMTADK